MNRDQSSAAFLVLKSLDARPWVGWIELRGERNRCVQAVKHETKKFNWFGPKIQNRCAETWILHITFRSANNCSGRSFPCCVSSCWFQTCIGKWPRASSSTRWTDIVSSLSQSLLWRISSLPILKALYPSIATPSQHYSFLSYESNLLHQTRRHLLHQTQRHTDARPSWFDALSEHSWLSSRAFLFAPAGNYVWRNKGDRRGKEERKRDGLRWVEEWINIVGTPTANQTKEVSARVQA